MFGEVTARVILSTTNPQDLLKLAEQMGLNAYDIGTIGGERFTLEYESERVVDVGIDELESAWRQGLTKLLNS